MGCQEMPPELLEKIFTYLPNQDRCNAQLSCRHFRDVLQLPIFHRTKSFNIIGQDEKEGKRISRFLQAYGTDLKHMTICLKTRTKPNNTNAQRRRVTSEFQKLLNTKQLWSFKCHHLRSLVNGTLLHDNGKKETILTALVCMLQQQDRLRELVFTDSCLHEEDGCRLLQALATSSTASKLTSMTLRDFFSDDVAADLCPVFLALMGKLSMLVSVDLPYHSVTATVLAALTSGSAFLKRIVLILNQCQCHNFLPLKLPDWQLVRKKRPDLRVWVSMTVYSLQWRYQDYLSPAIPLAGFSLERIADDEEDADIERDITDLTRCISHHSVKSLILDLHMWDAEQYYGLNPEILVELVKACSSLNLLCLQMEISTNTLVKVAAAAHPQSRRAEEEGGHSATPDAPSFQIHVIQDMVLNKSVLERLSRANPFCSVHNCEGCEPVVSKAGFI